MYGGVGVGEVNKLREVIRVLNADLVAKEDIVSRYKHLEREREGKLALANKSIEENKTLKE